MGELRGEKVEIWRNSYHKQVLRGRMKEVIDDQTSLPARPGSGGDLLSKQAMTP